MLNWKQLSRLESVSFVCGYCSNDIASDLGYIAENPIQLKARIYICHHCYQPTFFDLDSNQTPAGISARSVPDITDDDVRLLYEEIRRSASSNAFTSVVLCCRKLLMHVAVSKGAASGLKFIEYVQYLVDNHFVPLDAKVWLDRIRTKGNEENHEIVIASSADAALMIDFIEMLLKMTYEFPARILRDTKP